MLFDALFWGGSRAVHVTPDSLNRAHWRPTGGFFRVLGFDVLLLVICALVPDIGLAQWVWSKPATALSPADSSSRTPRISANDLGQAVGIWSYLSGPNWVIQTSAFQGGQWQTKPTQISATGLDSGIPQIAINAQGSARAVWVQAGRQGVNGVMTAFFDATKSPGVWSTPQLVSSVSQEATAPQLLLDDNANAQLVYTQSNGVRSQVIVRAIVGGELQKPQMISAATEEAAIPQISARGEGDFVVAWTSTSQGGQNSALVVQSSKGVLGPIISLGPVSSQAQLPALATDKLGVTTALWMETRGQSSQVFSRQLVDGVWGARTPLSPAGLVVNFPRIVSIGEGRAMAAWIQQLPNGGVGVRTREFTAGKWGAPKDQSLKENALVARLAGRPNGSATLVWMTQSASTTAVNASFYNGQNWTLPEELGKGGTDAVSPDVAMPTDQSAQALWLSVPAGRDQVQAMGGTYTPAQYGLALKRVGDGRVISSPAGIDCGTGCMASYNEGTQVTLTPEVGPGQNFIQWGGACTGSGPCQFRMAGETVVRATFVASNDYAIKVIRPSQGQISSVPAGILCGLGEGRCKQAFGKDAVVVLTATAKEGSEWVRWRNCPAAEGVRCEVLLSQPVTELSAVFRPKPRYRLAVSKNRGGTVMSDPAGLRCGVKATACGARFIIGTQVKLTAMPSAGMLFGGWEEGCSGQDPICSVSLDGPLKVKAHFVPQSDGVVSWSPP